ncbi:protein ABSCISIC ACID-INSENSITIVE 5 [Prosopis cineraria]|uniref:protein ABSCISIC ACID-INSENSITIVE 5 n=1 Tax=Prosopis cineraria TaxID=364024 RepID=UPI00240EA7CD|nr:protein ABSCISIC ACID-INSENSITIVE 5 [Prosopis cineraria]
MVVAEGEVDSSLKSDQTLKNQAMSSLGRQSSIYALTLDEFQHRLCEEGKNFGSMNMDEFLSSIWNVEENQTINNSNSDDKGARKQPSLSRQGSLTIPTPLSRKTVDQVWSEIHNQTTYNNGDANNNVRNSESAPRQPTYGEMTLEDFLIKAGVVREPNPMPAQYGLYPHNKPATGPTFIGYAGNGKRDASGYPPPGVCYGGGGYGVAPVSPVSSSDGMAARENAGGGQYGMEMGMVRGRKRIMEGPVEKLVERRQRRMIKNRESAARSRARKQAYTVELEAELNQLRNENAQLKLALVELERRRKRQCLEELKNNDSRKGQTKSQKAQHKLRALRRNQSCHL